MSEKACKRMCLEYECPGELFPCNCCPPPPDGVPENVVPGNMMTAAQCSHFCAVADIMVCYPLTPLPTPTLDPEEPCVCYANPMTPALCWGCPPQCPADECATPVPTTPPLPTVVPTVAGACEDCTCSSSTAPNVCPPSCCGCMYYEVPMGPGMCSMGPPMCGGVFGVCAADSNGCVLPCISFPPGSVCSGTPICPTATSVPQTPTSVPATTTPDVPSSSAPYSSSEPPYSSDAPSSEGSSDGGMGSCPSGATYNGLRCVTEELT